MKSPTRIILLTVLLLVGRFAYGQEDTLIGIGKIDLAHWSNFNREEPKIFLLEIHRGNKIKAYSISNIHKPGDDVISINGKLISSISHVFSYKIIGKKTYHSHISSIGDTTFSMVEILSAKPIVKSIHYIIDTTKQFDLLGRWTFVGFENSTDSVFAYDIDLALDTFKIYKFESFPNNKDSIFGSLEINSNNFIEFRKKNIADTSSFNFKFLLRAGCHNYWGNYTSLFEGNMEPRITRDDWKACWFNCPERTYFSKLYLNAIANIGSYKINHNELSLKDKTSKRLMIFVRDENYIPKEHNDKSKIH